MGITVWTDLSSVLSQSTRLTDGYADSFLVTIPPCIQRSAVKSLQCTVCIQRLARLEKITVDLHTYGPEATEFSEITQTTRPLRRSRSFKVTDFGTNRKPIYDFLLIINSNWPLLSCTVSKLRLIICKILARDSRALHFNALAGGYPLRISP